MSQRKKIEELLQGAGVESTELVDLLLKSGYIASGKPDDSHIEISNVNVQSALDKITGTIRDYRKEINPTGEMLNEWLQCLTSFLFYLEKERATYHLRFQRIIHDGVNNGDSVSRSENTAHVRVPEMYLLRRVMDAGFRVADAMRTNISYLKSERHHTPNAG